LPGALARAGRLDEAEQAYLRALERAPKHPRAYWNLENLRTTSPLAPSPQPSPARGEGVLKTKE
jgi:tetratricopeptide (TPR) repeat protein